MRLKRVRAIRQGSDQEKLYPPSKQRSSAAKVTTSTPRKCCLKVHAGSLKMPAEGDGDAEESRAALCVLRGGERRAGWAR